MKIHAFILSVLVLLSLVSLTRTQNNVCYNAEGVQSSVLFPCDPTAVESGCCEQGEPCYNNGMCGPRAEDAATVITPLFWHGCTDPSFNTSVCLDECMPYSGNGIRVCSNIGVGYYCCYGLGGCDCVLGDARVFSLPAATIVTTIASTKTTTASSSSSRIVTTDTSSSTSITSSDTMPSSSSASSVTVSPTTSSTTTPSPEPQSHNKTAIGYGVGVGVGGAVVVVVAAFFVIRRIRQRKVEVAYSWPVFETRNDQQGYQDEQQSWQKPELDAQQQQQRTWRFEDSMGHPQELEAKQRQHWGYGEPRGPPVELYASKT